MKPYGLTRTQNVTCKDLADAVSTAAPSKINRLRSRSKRRTRTRIKRQARALAKREIQEFYAGYNARW